MSAKEIVPDKLVQVERFREDMGFLWQADADLLEKVRESLPIEPGDLHTEGFVNSGAERCAIDPEKYRRIALSLKFLVVGVSSGKASAEELVNYVADQISPEADSAARRTLLASLIEATDSEKDESVATEDFSFGVTYKGTAVQPLVVPSMAGSDVRMSFGANVEIDYYEANSEVKVLSFNMSHSELRGMIARLSLGLQEIDAIRDKMDGLGKESGRDND